MTYATEMIDKAKEKLEIDTNYKLWKATGISQSRLSDYQNKGTPLNPDDCIAIAKVLNMRTEKIIVEAAIEKCKVRKNSLKLKKICETLSITYIAFLIPSVISEINQCILC